MRLDGLIKWCKTAIKTDHQRALLFFCQCHQGFGLIERLSSRLIDINMQPFAQQMFGDVIVRIGRTVNKDDIAVGGQFIQ